MLNEFVALYPEDVAENWRVLPMLCYSCQGDSTAGRRASLKWHSRNNAQICFDIFCLGR